MKKIFFFSIYILTGLSLFAAGDYDKPIFSDDSNIAVDGWDPVSYFEDNLPREGKEQWQTEYKDTVWFFSSWKNLELFNENPEKYSPAYGGYCSWAMNDGKLAPGKPEHWDIINNRLYLNYSSSTRKKFLADLDSMIENADSYWPEIEMKLSTGSGE